MEIPREIFQIILQMKHEKAVEEILPKWQKEHKILSSEVFNELENVTGEIRFELLFSGPNDIIKCVKKYPSVEPRAGRLYQIHWYIDNKNTAPDVDFAHIPEWHPTKRMKRLFKKSKLYTCATKKRRITL
jgi:hypothetical protein